MASFTGYEKKLSSRTAMSFSWGNTFSGWRSGRSANSPQSTVKRAKTLMFGHLETRQLCAKITWTLSYA